MPIIITQCWSNTGFHKESWGIAARERFTVTGVLTKNAAIEAAIPHAQIHPDNANLRVKSRDATQTGPISFDVVAEYAFGDVGLCADDPLLEPPRIKWEKVRETFAAERDTSQRPILNSAGQPFNPPITETTPQKALIVTKAMPSFNVSLSAQYEDTASNDAVTIQGAGSFTPGQIYCDQIEPNQEYTRLAPYVWVGFRFLVAFEGVDPFQAHPVDEGMVGWYKDASNVNQLGAFCDSQGNLAPFDVRLDGTGKPIDSRWYCWSELEGKTYSPIANPSLPAGLLVEPTLSSSTIKTLTWNNKVKKPFNGLI